MKSISISLPDFKIFHLKFSKKTIKKILFLTIYLSTISFFILLFNIASLVKALSYQKEIREKILTTKKEIELLQVQISKENLILEKEEKIEEIGFTKIKPYQIKYLQVSSENLVSK